MTINLKADSSTAVQLSVARSESNVKASIESVINSMNEFKAELDRLTFIDVDGDNNGPLSMDPSVKMMQSNFKKLLIEPISGYGSNKIYLSQLGIKTNASGQLYFDSTETSPATFNLFVGKSLSEKVGDFMTAILDTSSSVNKAETAYKTTKTDIATRLSDLEEKEKLLTTTYTEKFGAMETAMTQFNSTKTLLENFIEAWKKQK